MDAGNKFDEKEAWNLGMQAVDALGRIPPVFTHAVRALILEEARCPYEDLSSGTEHLLARLIHSPTLKSTLYHAAITYYDDISPELMRMNSRDILKVFRRSDLAVIIAARFFYARIVMRLSGQQRAVLDELISVDGDLGGHIGCCVPDLTPGYGIFIGVLAPLAPLLLVLNSPDKEVRKDPCQALLYTHEQQLAQYGGNGLHVLAAMLQKMGFGMDWTNGLIKVWNRCFASPQDSYQWDEADEIGSRLHITKIWFDSLKATGQTPIIELPNQFIPRRDAMNRLLGLTEELSNNGSRFHWLSRGKDDIIQSAPTDILENAPLDEDMLPDVHEIEANLATHGELEIS
jgi:hypothetical protein